jgi:ferredoxin
MAVTPAKLPKTIEDIVDVKNFQANVIDAYERGVGDIELEANLDSARSAIPAASAALRDFSTIAPEIPEFISENCIGCMDCVTECPDTAILARVKPESQMRETLAGLSEEDKHLERDWAETKKYHTAYQKQKKEPGLFGIFIDPSKCKGCAECVQICDDDALRMIKKTDENMPVMRRKFEHFKEVGPTPDDYINDKLLIDMMLADRSLQYVGGAGSCAGCGEGTALRMMVAATCFQYGQENMGIIASTGCNTVYSGRTRSSRTARPTPWACAPAGTRRAGATRSSGSSAATAP